MKKSEFKKIIKPIVSECIKESLMEDGLISGIIAEVVKGMATTAPAAKMIEATPDPVSERMKRNAFDKKQTKQLQEHRSKLMSAVGKGAYNGVNLFEGTAPLAGATPKPGAPPAPQGPLTGVAPGDSGVDISNLFGAFTKRGYSSMIYVFEKKS